MNIWDYLLSAKSGPKAKILGKNRAKMRRRFSGWRRIFLMAGIGLPLNQRFTCGNWPSVAFAKGKA